MSRSIAVFAFVVACQSSQTAATPTAAEAAAPATAATSVVKPAPSTCTDLFAPCTTRDGKPGRCAEAMPTQGAATLHCIAN